MSQPTTQPDHHAVESPPFLTIRDACRELHISRSTLNRFLGTELPITRFGRSVRIDRADLETFKRACRQRPTRDGGEAENQDVTPILRSLA